MACGLALGVSASACSIGAFICETDDQCTAVDGRCEASGYCSVPDPNCVSGRRWDESADPAIRKRCLDDEPMAETDGSTSVSMDGSGSDGSASDGTSAGPSPQPVGSTGGGPQGGPLAHYPLDEAIAGTVLEGTGFGPDGRCDPSQCPDPRPSPRGGAAGFDGVDDVVQIDDDDGDLRDLPGLTVGAWIKPEFGATRTYAIATKPAPGNNPTWQLLYIGDGTRSLESQWQVWWQVETETGPATAGVNLFPGTAWIHVAGTWDGSEVRLYVDGQRSDDGPAGPLLWGDDPILIGATVSDGGAMISEFEGVIDEMVVYDRALDDGEVADLVGDEGV